MSRQAMSPAERRLRSQLTKLLYDQPMLRGTLGIRKITCGSPTCRCARGFTHDTLYLTYARDGKRHQVSIPKELENQVRHWVHNHRTVMRLLDEVCERSHEVIRGHKSPRS